MNTTRSLGSFGATVLSALALTFALSLPQGAAEARNPFHGSTWDPHEVGLDRPPRIDARALPRPNIAPLVRVSALGAEGLERTAGGPPGTKDRRVDLSAAHNLVRYFGVDSPFSVSDAALASALADDGSLTPSGIKRALEHYDTELPDVIALHAGPDRIGPARLWMFGPLAVIRPGTGSIVIPQQAQIVVVDLRDLPALDSLNEILPRMVASALAAPVEQPARLLRIQDGPVDEMHSPTNVYTTTVGLDRRPPLLVTGSRELPIILIVGQKIAPQAAAFAATLRSAGRAWIAGKSVPLAVAETEWQGVGHMGLAVRTSTFLTLDPLPPTVLPNQVVAQDDPDDPSLSSFFYEFSIPDGMATVEISIDGQDTDDPDLYIVHDSNGDGVFDFYSEYIAAGATASPDESVELPFPSAGNYQVVVHGYYVESGTSTFELEIAQTLGALLPDEMQADLPVNLVLGGTGNGDHSKRLSKLSHRVIGATPSLASGPAERTTPLPVDPFGFIHPESGGRGELRAALIISHGVVRRFFRYFPIVGDTIDARLLETLRLADRHDGEDRFAAWQILRRFGEALHDGHQRIYNAYPFGFVGNLPVFLEHPGDRPDQPVVRRSLAPGVNPGDTIVRLEGRPIAQVYQEELARTSAATLAYKLDIIDRYIYQMTGPMTLRLKDANGVMRNVTVPVPTGNEYFDVVNRSVSDRPSGLLGDLGAPQLYYFNMNGFNTPNNAAMRTAISQASQSGAQGMVLDMRGYTRTDNYEVAGRLIQTQFLSPIFDISQFTGADTSWASTIQYTLFPYGAPRFNGPIVLLTGPHAVSASENFMQMLVGAQRLVAVVGHQSAATNGNISAAALPGGFGFAYTGLEVTNPDGSLFHGIGIEPDVQVPVTAVDLRDGVDRDLLEAIDVLD